MSVTSRNPSDLVEVAPPIPPLARAITEEQHQQQLDAASKQVRGHPPEPAAASLLLPMHINRVPKQLFTSGDLPPSSSCPQPTAPPHTPHQPTHTLPQRQEEERAAAAAAAAAEEAARAEALQREYEASLPDDVRDKVHAVLARELVSRTGLAAGRAGQAGRCRVVVC